MEITIPVFCKTGILADSDWGNDERWEIINKTVSGNQMFKNSDDFIKGDCYYPITIGTKKCYSYIYPNSCDKPLIRNNEESELMVERLKCEDQHFWDYFLEEENFRKLIELGKGKIIPSRKEMYLFLPPETIDYNKIPEDYKTTIHQRREMTIRADIYFGYRYEQIKYMINNAIKKIYIGLLEYSGYKEIENENDLFCSLNEEEITFLEHEILGLEIG
jgi:hypothetical protein